MNFVETHIRYTLPPLSIRDFYKKKSNLSIKEQLDKASLYMIVKRRVPHIVAVDDSPLIGIVKENVISSPSGGDIHE